MKTWYTQPKKSFASFYYFDEKTRELIRIRLELGRKDKGSTKAIYTSNRYIGFSTYRLDKSLFAIKNDKIISTEKGGITLTDKATVGYYVYDASSDDGIIISGHRHNGNKVSKSPKLPKSITEKDLIALAKETLNAKKSITLTTSSSDESKLVSAIKTAIKKIISKLIF